MPAFLDWFVSLDGYGEPVSVSYKGDSSYKTLIGALLTVGMRSFMLFFTLLAVFELLDYKNPQINQFRVFNNRSDGEEINLGEANAFFVFGFFNPMTNRFDVADPSIASIKMEVVQADWSSANPFDLNVVKDLELVSIFKETHPQYFTNGSALNGFDTTGLYGMKDPSEASMINDY